MTRSWGSLRAIITSLLHVMPKMTSLVLLLILFMFISAVAGMQLIGDRLPSDNRARFSNFGVAMLTIFQVLCCTLPAQPISIPKAEPPALMRDGGGWGHLALTYTRSFSPARTGMTSCMPASWPRARIGL